MIEDAVDLAASLDRPSRSPEEIERLTAAGIARADRRISEGLAAAMALGTPRFDAVFGPLDDAARIAYEAFGLGGVLREVAPEPEARQAAAAAVDALEGWRNELPQRPDIVAAVDAVARSVDPAALDPDRASLLRRWQADIRLGGADLGADARAEIQTLHARLVELQGRFIMNLRRRVQASKRSGSRSPGSDRQASMNVSWTASWAAYSSRRIIRATDVSRPIDREASSEKASRSPPRARITRSRTAHPPVRHGDLPRCQ